MAVITFPQKNDPLTPRAGNEFGSQGRAGEGVVGLIITFSGATSYHMTAIESTVPVNVSVMKRGRG